MSDSITIRGHYYATVVPQYYAVFPKPWRWTELPGVDGDGKGIRWANGQYMRYARWDSKRRWSMGHEWRAWLTSELRP